MIEQLYNKQQVAERLGCSPSHVDREERRGRLRGTKCGKLLRFSASAITEYIEQGTRDREFDIPARGKTESDPKVTRN